MLFNRPFQDIGVPDIEEIRNTQYPESDQVEYKEFVPGREGPDQWHADQTKGISDYGRDKLLAEIIGFANTHGGHLIVGIEESADKRAVAIKPVPKCEDLADRLKRTAFTNIEPRLGNLQIAGVPTQPDGSGVVIARVGPSTAAPHRLISKQSDTARQCYVRRGDSTEALTMREIQDLTLNVVRGFDAVEKKFASMRAQFEKTADFESSPDQLHVVGIRCSAVPIQELHFSRKSVEQALQGVRRDFLSKSQSGGNLQLLIPVYGHSSRPTLRGTLNYNDHKTALYEHTIYLDGSQTMMFINRRHAGDHRSDEPPNTVFSSWILGAVATVLHAVSALAIADKTPGTEYGIELQVTSQRTGAHIKLGDYGWSGELPQRSFLFPQYSYSPDDDAHVLLDQIYGDLLNALGYQHNDPIVSVVPR